MDQIYTFQSKLTNNSIYTSFELINQKIIYTLNLTKLTSDLLVSPTSKFITLIFVYTFIAITIYETILNTGIYFNLWKKPGHDIFIETPTHVAHLYVKLNVFEDNSSLLFNADSDSNSQLSFKSLKVNKSNQINYHFEFSPDEYKDEQHGTDLLHLKQKILDWFLDSKTYKLHYSGIKFTLSNIHVFDKHNKLIPNTEDTQYLCNLKIVTGSSLNCLITLP